MGSAFYSVIPAGGSGTRLWPLSRANRPKFLLPLLDGRSLLQETVRRIEPLCDPDHMFTVSGLSHAAAIARQLPKIPEENLILEPAPRGTAPAISLAAMLIARQAPNAVLGSFAADHLIEDVEGFQQALSKAISAAELGHVTTIGVSPTRPETGYGYIERSDDIVSEGAYAATRFIEKPDFERAQQFVEARRYLWNASIFVWRVDVFLSLLQAHQPILSDLLMDLVDRWDTQDRDAIMGKIWFDLPEISIDQGIMEKIDSFLVVPADIGWSDVGDWNGIAELFAPDRNGNRVRGELVGAGATNCVVWAESDRVVALVGVDNLAVVDTPDALLVVNRKKAQDVRKIVDQLDKERSQLR